MNFQLQINAKNKFPMMTHEQHTTKNNTKNKAKKQPSRTDVRYPLPGFLKKGYY
jgi:hypothetical protein